MPQHKLREGYAVKSREGNTQVTSKQVHSIKQHSEAKQADTTTMGYNSNVDLNCTKAPPNQVKVIDVSVAKALRKINTEGTEQ
jgi:hypothetical protein